VYTTDASDVSNWVRLSKLVVKTYAFVLSIFGTLALLVRVDILLQYKLLGNVGSSGSGSGSGNVSANNNKLSELILDNIRRSSDGIGIGIGS
jgi:hypothetical protein